MRWSRGPVRSLISSGNVRAGSASLSVVTIFLSRSSSCVVCDRNGDGSGLHMYKTRNSLPPRFARRVNSFSMLQESSQRTERNLQPLGYSSYKTALMFHSDYKNHYYDSATFLKLITVGIFCEEARKHRVKPRDFGPLQSLASTNASASAVPVTRLQEFTLGQSHCCAVILGFTVRVFSALLPTLGLLHVQLRHAAQQTLD